MFGRRSERRIFRIFESKSIIGCTGTKAQYEGVAAWNFSKINMRLMAAKNASNPANPNIQAILA
jgi:hypothetical protein